jgi:hypothetical protein
MGKAVGQALRFLLSLAVLAGLVVGAAAGFRYLLHYLFHGVSPTVAAAIVAAGATGLLSLLTWILQRRDERKKAIAQEIRTRKIEIYTRMLEHWFEIFGLGEDRSDAESERAIAAASTQIARLTPLLLSWASDDVLSSWSKYRRAFSTPGADPVALMLGFEQFLFVVRRDVGHANKGLQTGDLLALWVNDVDEAIMPFTQPAKAG